MSHMPIAFFSYSVLLCKAIKSSVAEYYINVKILDCECEGLFCKKNQIMLIENKAIPGDSNEGQYKMHCETIDGIKNKTVI